MEKRLFRNEHDKVIAGISSGIAEYMEIDVILIRLLFVLSGIFLVGMGVLVYIIMWIVLPVNNDPTAKFSKFNDYFKDPNNPFQSQKPFGSEKAAAADSKPDQNWSSSTVKGEDFGSWKPTEGFKPYQKNTNETGRTVAGLFLLVIGMYFLMNEFGMIPFWFQLSKLWPLVFVAIGVSFLIQSKDKNAWESWRDKNVQTPGSPEGNSLKSADAPEDLVEPSKAPDQDTETNDPFEKKEI